MAIGRANKRDKKAIGEKVGKQISLKGSTILQTCCIPNFSSNTIKFCLM
jgi:hypothetical protein